jgi:hypothetical protein
MGAALGFRAHTGWAAAVVLGEDWQVLKRRRIILEPKATRFIYHRAAEIPFDEALSLIGDARNESLSAAKCEIGAMLASLADHGTKIRAACVSGGNSRLPESLADILAAHSRIHAAEGAFYRDVLAEACARQGLSVARVPERDLWRLAASAIGASERELRERLNETGKRLRPPWGEDQMLAALAATFAGTSRPSAGKP